MFLKKDKLLFVVLVIQIFLFTSFTSGMKNEENVDIENQDGRIERIREKQVDCLRVLSLK